MRTRTEEKVDLKRSGNMRQQLEANALGQAVLDHGDHALADAAPFTEELLGREMLKTDVTKVDAEVQDHVFDRARLLTKVVRHASLKHAVLTWHLPGMVADRADTRLNRPREIVKKVEPATLSTMSLSRTGWGAGTNRYNRRLTGRQPQPAHSRLPGQEEPVA